MAVGIGTRPVRQPNPLAAQWYQPNMQLLNTALAARQDRYNRNRAALSKLNSYKDKISALPGTPDEIVGEKIAEYLDSEKERISKMYSGDLSRATSELIGLEENISNLFGKNGPVSKINKSTKAYTEAQEELQKRLEKGEIKDVQYWYGLTKPLDEYKKKGYFDGTYSANSVSNWVDEDKLVADFLKDWKPDTIQDYPVEIGGDGKFYWIRHGKREVVPYSVLRDQALGLLAQNTDVRTQRRIMWEYNKAHDRLPDYMKDGNFKSTDDYLQDYRNQANKIDQQIATYNIDSDSSRSEIMYAQQEINDAFNLNIDVDGVWGPETAAAVRLANQYLNRQKTSLQGKIAAVEGYDDDELYNFGLWLDEELKKVASRWAEKEGYNKDLSTYKTGVDPYYSHMLKLSRMQKEHENEMKVVNQEYLLQRELYDYKKKPVPGNKELSYYNTVITPNTLGETIEEVNQSAESYKQDAETHFKTTVSSLYDTWRDKNNGVAPAGGETLSAFNKSVEEEISEYAKNYRPDWEGRSIEELFADGQLDNIPLESLNGSTMYQVFGDKNRNLLRDKQNAIRTSLDQYNLAEENMNRWRRRAIENLDENDREFIENKPEEIKRLENELGPEYEEWKEKRTKVGAPGTSFADFLQSRNLNAKPKEWVSMGMGGQPQPIHPSYAEEYEVSAESMEWLRGMRSLERDIDEKVNDYLKEGEKRSYEFTVRQKESEELAEMFEMGQVMRQVEAVDPLDGSKRIQPWEDLKDKDYKVTSVSKSNNVTAGGGYMFDVAVSFEDAEGNVQHKNYLIPRSYVPTPELSYLESSPGGVVDRNTMSVIEKGYEVSKPLVYENYNSVPTVTLNDDDEPVINTKKGGLQFTYNRDEDKYEWYVTNNEGEVVKRVPNNIGRSTAIAFESFKQMSNEMFEQGIPRFAMSETNGVPLTNSKGEVFDIHRVLHNEMQSVLYDDANANHVVNEMLMPLVINVPASIETGDWVYERKPRHEIIEYAYDDEGNEIRNEVIVHQFRDPRALEELMDLEKTKYKWNNVYRQTSTEEVRVDLETGELYRVPTQVRSTTYNRQ